MGSIYLLCLLTHTGLNSSQLVCVLCMFFTLLTDRASVILIPSNVRYAIVLFRIVVVVVVVVVFTLKAVPVSTQYFLTSVLVQLTRTPSVVTG